ncbi:MAG: O-antigen ligase family protein [Lachnospiraceae bacterium]|nr:O-antigen ligase family protein [Lachnospiraceae bacterium]
MSTKNKTKKKNGGLNTSQSLADYFLHGAVMVFVAFLLCLYPLLYHDKYFDMGASKWAIFKWACLVGFSIITVLWAWWAFAYRDRVKPMEELKHLSGTDIAVLAFLLISLLSFMLAEDKVMALWGYDGWFMGIMSQLFFVLLYIYTSRFWRRSYATLFLMVLAAAWCYQIGILQRFGFNPMGMYDGVGEEDIEKFLSTLGQTSWYSSYAILIVPFGMYAYWKAEKKAMRIASGFFVALSFGMLCTTNSDSAYVAMVLICMVFFRYSLEENERMARFLEMITIGLFSLRVIGWMHRLFPERQRTYITGEEAISKFVTDSPVMLILLILMLLITGAVRVYLMKTENKKERFEIKSIAKPVWTVTVVAAILVIWAVILCVILVSGHKLPEGSALYNVNFFNFDLAWGNHRGFNWRAAVEALSRANLKDMLVGVGPDCFAMAMDKYYMQEVAEYWHGLQLACAHNEWLNMLVTEGILGVAAYIAVFVTAMIGASKRAVEDKRYIPYMCAILAYMGHNMFCYQQCICTPVVFIFIGIAGRYLRDYRLRGGEGNV